MYANRYFTSRYFPTHYFPNVGATPSGPGGGYFPNGYYNCGTFAQRYFAKGFCPPIEIEGEQIICRFPVHFENVTIGTELPNLSERTTVVDRMMRTVILLTQLSATGRVIDVLKVDTDWNCCEDCE